MFTGKKSIFRDKTVGEKTLEPFYWSVKKNRKKQTFYSYYYKIITHRYDSIKYLCATVHGPYVIHELIIVNNKSSTKHTEPKTEQGGM